MSQNPSPPVPVDPAQNPLIIQSDLIVLLEVAVRPVTTKHGPSRPASPSWRNHPNTFTPTGSRRSRCGTPPAAGPVSPGRWPRPRPGCRNIRCRRRSCPRSMTRWADTGGFAWSGPRHGGLALTSTELALLEEVRRDMAVDRLIGERLDGNRYAVRSGTAARQTGADQLGWPVADEAGYDRGIALAASSCRPSSAPTKPTRSAPGGGGPTPGGSGVLVFPAGRARP